MTSPREVKGGPSLQLRSGSEWLQMRWLRILYLSPFQAVEEKRASLGLFLCPTDSPGAGGLACSSVMGPTPTTHETRGLSSALADSLTKNKRWLTRCECDNSGDQ